MRLIGDLANESAARTFADYLCVEGIDSQIERQRDDEWEVWIVEEDKIEPAMKLLAAFRQNPADPKYRSKAKSAAELRAAAQQEQAAYHKRVRNRRQLFRPLTAYGFGPLTFVLIAVSVTVFILSKYGADHEPIMGLFITDFTGGTWDRSLPEIRQGEVWRLFTPMFIHFGPLHILCNMLWLRDLGSMIEARQSSWHLAALGLVIAACSNLAQCHVAGPDFGGMSGVVYGLLGYVWLRGKYDPGSGLYLHPSTVTMMIIWFFACLTPLVPHVANAAHAVGLVMGMGWGALSGLRHR